MPRPGRFGADRQVLERVGANALDAGCCGLAGNIGFEERQYELSMACAPPHLAELLAGGHRRQAAVPARPVVPRRRALLPLAVADAAARESAPNGARALDRGSRRPDLWQEGR